MYVCGCMDYLEWNACVSTLMTCCTHGTPMVCSSSTMTAVGPCDCLLTRIARALGTMTTRTLNLGSTNQTRECHRKGRRCIASRTTQNWTS